MPVSADLENCFADEPEGVAETIGLAVGAGLSGGSVEDFTGDPDAPIYPLELAVARVAAAAEAAHRDVHFVLTARAENHLRGHDDLDDTITRLQRYREAGADVVYAPGLTDAADIGRLVEAVDAPVNVLAVPGAPTVAELAALGVARCRSAAASRWSPSARSWPRPVSCGTRARTASGSRWVQAVARSERPSAPSRSRQRFDATRRRAGSSAAT